jgi:hypothetical protein
MRLFALAGRDNTMIHMIICLLCFSWLVGHSGAFSNICPAISLFRGQGKHMFPGPGIPRTTVCRRIEGSGTRGLYICTENCEAFAPAYICPRNCEGISRRSTYPRKTTKGFLHQARKLCMNFFRADKNIVDTRASKSYNLGRDSKGGKHMATRRQWDRWAQTIDWTATYTCRECSKAGQGYYVQPQPAWAGGGALCADCINRINRQIREERRRQLAAMPRCEVPGCNRRATIRHNGTGLCGRHWKRAEAVCMNRLLKQTGGLLMFAGPVHIPKNELIAAAQSR